MRITRPQMFMDIAHVVAKRATCMRLSVGAVLVSGRSIVSIGYNGVPSGHPHCAGNDCPGRYRCTETRHAEMNAMDHLPIGLPAHMKLDLYVTDSPCEACWNELRKSERIQRIFFSTPYRITDHLEMKIPHLRYAIGVYRITSSGYVMNWRTKELVEVDT